MSLSEDRSVRCARTAVLTLFVVASLSGLTLADVEDNFLPPEDDVGLQEPCPTDSVTTLHHTCECGDLSLVCPQPPCPSRLAVARNGTGEPGSCCPLYECLDCESDDRLPDGRCPCIPGAGLSPTTGKCECVNQLYSPLEGGKGCACDSTKCPLPTMCDDHSVMVVRNQECCSVVNCISCPEDSFPTRYRFADEETSTPDREVLEDKCVCLECSKAKCLPHQHIKIIRHGRNQPGLCCDIYECLNPEDISSQPTPSSGTSNGRCDPDKLSNDGKCFCNHNGILVCRSSETDEPMPMKKRDCYDAGATYTHGDTWMRDSCTNCTCLDGNSKCIAHMCDIVVSEIKVPSDCRTLEGCKKVCQYGYRTNRLGCEVCRCRAPPTGDKTSSSSSAEKSGFQQVEAVLKEHNLTEGEKERLLERLCAALEEGVAGDLHRRRVGEVESSTRSSVQSPTSVCMPAGHGSYVTCTYSCILEYAMPGFAVGAIFAGLLLFSLLKFAERNRHKYEMAAAYTYRPVGATATGVATGGDIIKRPRTPLELQTYEKKTVSSI